MKTRTSYNYLKIFLISLIAIALDYIFILRNISSPPGWDQGYHIANVFKMYNIINYQDINFFSKFSNVLDVTNSYRGPLTYLCSSLFLKVFGKNYTSVFLSNNIFNFICIFSTYKICEIFNNKKVGIWSIIIFTFSPFIFIQRTDYLIDLSLTAFSMLFFATLTFWFNSKKAFSNYSFLSGITFGLVFLVKPTGIIIFTIPIIFNFIKRIYLNNIIVFFKEFLSFNITFIFIIIPWLSRHWITIFSSINNAWQWGVKYQDGLEVNSFESWLYYFKIIPQYIGFPLTIFILIFLIFKILNYKNNKKLNISLLNTKHIWFLSFLLNSYLVLSIMSTKETRFLLPTFPIICIYIVILINQFYKYTLINKAKKLIIIILLISSFISKRNLEGSFGISNNILTFYNNWHHQEIIRLIQNENPKINQTLAVIPDTKEFNTFNLEAEALRQGESVTVRQIISNKENFKNDLKYFDWFLIKSGDQGIMTNEGKVLLNNYLLNSDSFFIFKEWKLTDDNKLLLLKRNELNSLVNKKKCSINTPSLTAYQYNNGIKIELLTKGENINDSNLFIDINNQNLNEEINLSLLNGRLIKPLKSRQCYEVSHNLPFTFGKNTLQNEFNLDAYIINKKNKKVLIPRTNYVYLDKFKNTNNEVFYENKIKTVKELGNLIRTGSFENLFYLVGILNQSDPSQIYLSNAEKIYSIKYENKQNLDDLYALLAAQILQKKAHQAEKTVNQILTKDSQNGNAYIAKIVIEIYQFKIMEAKHSIYLAKSISNKSNESKKIIEDIYKIFNFI